MTQYTSDDLLPLSGIQHFLFCRRQWALIHVERQWQENWRTVEGKHLHEQVDQPFFNESRNGLLITRSMPVASYTLGLVGVCDVVEFTPSTNGVKLHGRQGSYLAAPVEYKRGHQKESHCDTVQLCAQAICLEEMLSLQIPFGYIYYGETRRRLTVPLDHELREQVQKLSAEMHQYFSRGYTPKCKPSKSCKACSLRDICLPALSDKNTAVSAYIQAYIREDP